MSNDQLDDRYRIHSSAVGTHKADSAMSSNRVITSMIVVKHRIHRWRRRSRRRGMAEILYM
jgi:hypothetical protein